MKALVKTKKGPGNLELMDMPVPSAGEGEVLLKILAAGVCGTDIHVRDDNFPYWPPVILGHEFSGRIVKVGPGVTLFKEGDRVVGEPHTRACGHCYLCRTGNIQICPEKRSPGWGIDGAMAEYLVMPEKLLHRLPDSIPDDVGAVIEPTGNAVHDVLERARVQAGEFVVVIGPGPIGLLAAMTARAAGAREVVIIGTNSDESLRLEKARQLGFKTVNCQQQKASQIVQEMTAGIGADLVVECSGSAGGIASTVELIRKKGRICAIGLPGKQQVIFPYAAASFKVCDVFFCMSTSYTCWDTAINLVAAGKIPAGEIITHRRPLEEWKEVFDDIDNQRAIKAVLIP
ncbi:MAG TPA: alcohol dehydrogenase catalytic domain-containing protein [Phycisphaerae bacterium]|nr:alcohol dehydrogenase catalytic domain-containing protein [Phycisphaerae bacterium]HPS52263.1 alcohol dehydrogenase catalytic domain-containing protein [Phycisphaerae bacterium]